MSEFLVRAASPTDVAAIVAIRNAAVRHGTALWSGETTDPAEVAGWLAAAAAEHRPFLVADRGAGAAAYATYGRWRAKDGYRLTVEDSIYVADGHRGAGLGGALLAALLDAARDAGMHLMVADIESGNTASIRMHAAAGFEVSGRIGEVGTKFGRWLDLTIMTLRLNEASAPAGPPTPAAD